MTPTAEMIRGCIKEDARMSLVVNYNDSAFNAHRNLQGTDRALKTSIQHLSSGMRVNNASDDPAGLVISQQMRGQIEGIGRAINNANDGVNLVKTAEAALNEVHSLLTQMRGVAVHAANSGVNSTEAVAADQAQLDKAVTAIDRIAGSTRFNGKSLLDGTYTNQVFQIGANSSDTVAMSITNQDASTLAVNSLNLSTDAAGAIDAIDAAIGTVSTNRADLGSFQKNTLESTINSLSIAKENIAGAESTIRDADMASEMVTFTRNNIMLQAGTAMLAQANQSPQAVLQLLR
jgi:flagellin